MSGCRLLLDGSVILRVILNDTAPHDQANVELGVEFVTRGVHRLLLEYFQVRKTGAIELFSAAGQHESFDGNFSLLAVVAPPNTGTTAGVDSSTSSWISSVPPSRTANLSATKATQRPSPAMGTTQSSSGSSVWLVFLLVTLTVTATVIVAVLVLLLLLRKRRRNAAAAEKRDDARNSSLQVTGNDRHLYGPVPTLHDNVDESMYGLTSLNAAALDDEDGAVK